MVNYKSVVYMAADGAFDSYYIISEPKLQEFIVLIDEF
ncbi:hypothetical protein J517_3822 [Acinetobacter baumannii 118362]|nr:hypothetical protein J517_3822 [Acinetobacter baumannii 118362]